MCISQLPPPPPPAATLLFVVANSPHDNTGGFSHTHTLPTNLACRTSGPVCTPLDRLC